MLFVALASPIGTYDTTLFSVHMVQHLLLTMVAAPLLVMGAPITLLLRLFVAGDAAPRDPAGASLAAASSSSRTRS